MTDGSLVRIVRIGIALAIAGGIYVLTQYGATTAAGFIAGSALSIFSFHTLRKLGAGLQPGPAPFRGSAAVFGLRYVIIAAVAYVTIKVLGISALPLVAGLFVSAAAVIVEILYELLFLKHE